MLGIEKGVGVRECPVVGRQRGGGRERGFQTRRVRVVLLLYPRVLRVSGQMGVVVDELASVGPYTGGRETVSKNREISRNGLKRQPINEELDTKL